jgi:hypothetical protein
MANLKLFLAHLNSSRTRRKRRLTLPASLMKTGAHPSQSTGSKSFIVETIEERMRTSGAPSLTVSAERSFVGVRQVVPALLTAALDRTIDIHQRPTWHLAPPEVAVARHEDGPWGYDSTGSGCA